MRGFRNFRQGVGPDTFLVINVFKRDPYGPPSRSNFNPMGPIASEGVSVPEFLRKHIATCDFPERVGGEPPAPSGSAHVYEPT